MLREGRCGHFEPRPSVGTYYFLPWHTIEWFDDDDAFLVTLPEWEGRVFGPVSHGESYEEAVRNAKEALVALVASAQKHGEPLPTPRTYAEGQRAS
ncbi:MAG: type II toxin-antitoxin system HicB family antitoxin [Chloroflexota bacterium]